MSSTGLSSFGNSSVFHSVVGFSQCSPLTSTRTGILKSGIAVRPTVQQIFIFKSVFEYGYGVDREVLIERPV